MSMLRLGRAFAALAIALVSQPTVAATQADLQRVDAALRRVAAPWCDRLAEFDSQGRRQCKVTTHSLGPIGTGNAFAFFDMTTITDELLAVLSPDELAAALGHELAHLVLGHGIVNLRQAPAAADDVLMSVTESLGVEPHEDTPVDPVQQELDADTLGLVFAGLAGYDVRRGAAVWRTIARRFPAAAQGGAAHPDAARRLVNADQVARSFCLAAAASKPPWPATERLLPRYEVLRDEAARQVDATALAHACGRPAHKIAQAH